MFVLYILCTIIVAILIVKHLFFSKYYRYPNGPPGLPFIGNALQLSTAPQLKHAEWAGVYGDAHTVTMFGQQSLILNTLDIVNECKLEHSDDFNHRPIWLDTIVKLSPGIVFKGVTDYQNNRKFALKHLKLHGMGKSELEPRILQEMESLILHIDLSETFNPNFAMEIFSVNVISRLCISMSWPYSNDQYSNVILNALRKMFDLFNDLILFDYLPFLKILPTVKNKYNEMNDNVNIILYLIKEAVKTRQLQANANSSYNSDDLLDDFLRTHKYSPSEDQLNDFIEIAHDMFSAGTVTTSATITFGLIQLVNNLKLQDELFSEMENDLSGRDVPTMSYIQNLPLMEAFIQEVLRFYPAVPLIPHATYKDTRLRNYYIPKDTMVTINAHSINRDSKIFPNPNMFNPKRWLDENGKFKINMKENMITFGQGKRSCVGKPLARTEIFFTFVMLIKRYKLSVLEGTKLPRCEPLLVRANSIPEQFLLKASLRKHSN